MASLGSLAPLSTIYCINNCYKPCIGTTGFSLCKIKRCHEKKNNQSCIQASADGKTQHFRIAKEQIMEEVSQPMLVWRAIKLPIYSVALVPLTVASAAAYLHTGNFSARRYFGFLASSIFIIAWLNLSNDVYDFDTGADKNKKESVVNMVGSRTGTLVAANLLLALGSVSLTLIAVEAGTFRSMLLLASAIFCGYVYQCPPARLSYHGLGEPLCFAAFGPFATTAFYLMQSSHRNLYSPHSFMGTIVSASILVGYTTSLILFCSHFHQVEGDVAVGKISPLVRIGTEMGSEVVKISVAILYLLLFAFGLSGALPLVAIVFCGLTLPMGYMVTNYVKQNYNVSPEAFQSFFSFFRLAMSPKKAFT